MSEFGSGMGAGNIRQVLSDAVSCACQRWLTCIHSPEPCLKCRRCVPHSNRCRSESVKAPANLLKDSRLPHATVAAYHDDRRLDAQQVSDLLIPAVQRPRAIPRRHAQTLSSTHCIDGQADAANHVPTKALLFTSTYKFMLTLTCAASAKINTRSPGARRGHIAPRSDVNR